MDQKGRLDGNAQDYFMTLKEVASYLHMKAGTVYKWAQAGTIPASKLGSNWRFRKSEIDSWVMKHKNVSREELMPELDIQNELSGSQAGVFEQEDPMLRDLAKFALLIWAALLRRK